jgi:hypothetical protein
MFELINKKIYPGDNHSLFGQRVRKPEIVNRKPEPGNRKPDRMEPKRAKCGSVDSTPLLTDKFKHNNRSARKGRWSLAYPIAAYQVFNSKQLNLNQFFSYEVKNNHK